LSLRTSFKLPCGSKNFYPEKLDYLTRKGGKCVFNTLSDKTEDGFLVVPLKKGVEIVGQGPAVEVALYYEALDLVEHEIKDINGIFFYKFAESEDELKDALKKVSPSQ